MHYFTELTSCACLAYWRLHHGSLSESLAPPPLSSSPTSLLTTFTLKKRVALPALILAPIGSSISLKMSVSCTPAKAYTV